MSERGKKLLAIAKETGVESSGVGSYVHGTWNPRALSSFMIFSLGIILLIFRSLGKYRAN